MLFCEKVVFTVVYREKKCYNKLCKGKKLSLNEEKG